MAKTIDTKVSEAFNSDRVLSLSNTKVFKTDLGIGVKLWDTVIAFRFNNSPDSIFITNGNYQTITTKNRISAILPYPITLRQSKGFWYLNNIKWSGNMTEVVNNDWRYINKDLLILGAKLKEQ